ncbi:MAG: ATP-binding cassette domain-containing protein [Intestinimonas sp.]|jgi:energy-coupling factor transport system ATP-binding protein|nr:ATP-binding cassette domain-containing protein [Intestinimonas sp.]
MDSFAVSGLTFFYPEQTRAALDDVTVTVEQGQFVTLCGPSGCGKSTLLRQLKTVLAPHGARTGAVRFEGRALDELDRREQSAKIGFVQQNPDNQIVTDKVWHELAFGLESLGYDTPAIRARVAEMASFFGIQGWFYQNVSELSGGQKQLLNLASIMAMQPSVLILDEPTSQLDPIAASDFLATVGKINRELGTTVILTEHRLEEVFPLSDRVLVMDGGTIVCDGTPKDVGMWLRNREHAMFFAMPAPMRIYAAVPNDQPCPITVREGRDWLDRYAKAHPLLKMDAPELARLTGEAVLTLDDVWFKYEKDLPDVIKGLSLTVRRGEFLAVLGGNGTGKTTMLSLMAGLNRPYRGKITGSEPIGTLPQNPQALFVKKTVREDLLEILRGKKFPGEDKIRKLDAVVRLCRLEELLERHPYDLSGGEQQRAALAKVLLLDPRILLLDEPTKGLDAAFKRTLAVILKTLLRRGVSIVMVSHDIEFCAEHASRCALFFDGNIVTDAPPRAFFAGNSFYTTSENRMARHLLPEAVTAADVIRACGGTVPPEPELPPEEDGPPENRPEAGTGAPKRLSLWRKLLAGISGAVILAAFLHAVGLVRMTRVFGTGYGIYFTMIVALFVLALAVGGRSEAPIEHAQVAPDKRRLPGRTVAAAVMILLLIPLTIFIGVFYLNDRKYYFISLLVMLECMLPFFLVFEGRKPQARELIIIAVLCAISVAGRAAFFMLPQFKPVMAMVILSGVAFGGESGFLVGAVTMLVSNIMFGQGPWTPWQMFTMGVIGFLAGVLFRKGLLRRTRLSLAIFGGIAAIVIFGGIMNPASALMWQNKINGKIILAYYVTGFPMDLVQAAATAFFLWFLSRPMLEKLDRIKVKYGLVETAGE